MVDNLKVAKWVGAFCFGLMLSSSVFADWRLNEEDSTVKFVSVKKDSVGEVHSFAKLSGELADEGAFSLAVDLNSVKTQIEIRDQRMKEHLFETVKFPTATITGQLDGKWLKSLRKGKPSEVDVDIVVDLHGKSVTKSVKLEAVKLNRKEILVNTTSPLILNASEFGLEPGVAMLQKLAALPSISRAVPVTVSLTFSK